MFLNVVPLAFFVASLGCIVYALLLATRLVTAVEQIARLGQRGSTGASDA